MIAGTGNPEQVLTENHELQRIYSPLPGGRMEGVAFHPSGELLAVATSDANRVELYRRHQLGWRFQTRPCCVLEAPQSPIDYPHDVDFSPSGELLAVAMRSGAITVFGHGPQDDTFGPAPAMRIEGLDQGLYYTDGVAFVPPETCALVACNLQHDLLTFYRLDDSEPALETRPYFHMHRGGVHRPDGLALSACGEFLAVANHGDHSVCVYRRIAGGDHRAPTFEVRPMIRIADPSMRFCHSVAFTPRYAHLLVTNAGTNYVNLYRRDRSGLWSDAPDQQFLMGRENVFREVNACNKREGGPKGIALAAGLLAVCRPETGLTLLPYRETPDGIELQRRRPLPPETRPARRSGVKQLPRRDGVRLVNPRNGQSTALNETGYLVFRLCDGALEVGEMMADLQSAFPDVSDIGTDVQTILAELYRADLIELPWGAPD